MKFHVIFDNLTYLLRATGVTVKITLYAFIVAVFLAFCIGTLRSRKDLAPIISWVLSFYIEVFRGTPLLIQLFFIYYGLPSIGLNMSSFTAAVVGLSLNSAAYMAEIIRASLLSVDKGQEKAAYVLGYSNLQTLFHIIYPQAIRIALPSLMNAFSTLLKESSLISVLAITELTRSGQLIYTRTYRAFEIYLTLGLIYFLLTYSVSQISKQIEKRVSIAYED